jgi:predicted NUDIX family phosphoesterase
MSVVHAERVLVVPAEVFRRIGYFQGFSPEVDRYLNELFVPENMSYRPRGEMEDDPSFKQLIPYVIFRFVDSQGTIHVFQYTRGKGQGEKRLHAKRSVGIGGHICIDDETTSPGSRPYEEGMRRELAEEVIVNTPYRAQMVGMINDDLTPVGSVHLGVVHIFDVEAPDVEPRETEILNSGFVPADQLLGQLEEFESWSQICLQALFG